MAPPARSSTARFSGSAAAALSAMIVTVAMRSRRSNADSRLAGAEHVALDGAGRCGQDAVGGVAMRGIAGQRPEPHMRLRRHAMRVRRRLVETLFRLTISASPSSGVSAKLPLPSP